MPDCDRLIRTSKYLLGVSLLNLTHLLLPLDHDQRNDGYVSTIIVILFTGCVWAAASIFIVCQFKQTLTSVSASWVVGWHVFCILFGLISSFLFSVPTMQTVQCCIASFSDVKGITEEVDFLCHSYSCSYMKLFVVLPYISMVWSSLTLHYQVHNIFRYLYERQQEATSYDRVIQRIVAAHQSGGGPLNLDGIILNNTHDTCL